MKKKQIQNQIDNPHGLHQRYQIQKIKAYEAFGNDVYGKRKEGIKFELEPADKGSEYFVMRLDEGGSDKKHIAACRMGVHAYADAIEPHLPKLAKDLRERYPLI